MYLFSFLNYIGKILNYKYTEKYIRNKDRIMTFEKERRIYNGLEFYSRFEG